MIGLLISGWEGPRVLHFVARNRCAVGCAKRYRDPNEDDHCQLIAFVIAAFWRYLNQLMHHSTGNPIDLREYEYTQSFYGVTARTPGLFKLIFILMIMKTISKQLAAGGRPGSTAPSNDTSALVIVESPSENIEIFRSFL